MRKIVTAVSAAALSLSMLASAVPALAVSGYDSAYAGESAFVNISPGQTLNFQVFFANTGTTTWSKGTGTEVDLAACLEDKTTCNAQDAPLSSAWLPRWRLAACAPSGAIKQQLALAGVARERCRALELCAGFVEATKLFQEVAAHARQEVVAPE